jgi:neurotransmitter:Na+ symporter, NSS family
MSIQTSDSSKTWKSQSGYIWSLIGTAVGFANILSFSAQAYKNGGGAFLIPYFMALLALGIPMLILEGMIGYRWKLPIVSAYGRVLGNPGKILGWIAVLACLTIGGFYIVLTGYSVAYTYFSAINAIPDDSKAFFEHTFLKISTGLTDFGQLSIPIMISTFCVGIGTWFVLVRNVRDGIERVCSIFMPLLAVIMVGFAIVVCFLPGGWDGWGYYLKPDFSRLSNPGLWRDVFGQLFFSLSLGLGIIVGYSRHTASNTNIVKAMCWMAAGDFIVSFIAGFAVFGCLAHISAVQGIPFEQILTSDSTFEIGFILFPQLLKFFGPTLSSIIGTVFFFCIFVAGVTGVFSIVESIAGNVEIEFKTTRKKAVSVTIVLITAFATLFCMGNASYLIDTLIPMVMGTNMMFGGLFMIIAFLYVSSEMKNDPVWFRNNTLNNRTWYGIALRYLAPIFLLISLIGNFWQEFHGWNLEKTVRWGWFLLAFTIAWILIQKTPQTSHAISENQVE